MSAHIIPFRNVYGARERNGLVDGNEYHKQFHDARKVDWTEKGLRITRLRLLSDPGFPLWDVSYCHGELNGEKVHVELPFSQLPKLRMSATIVQYAQRDGVFAKGLGIFEALSTLI